MSLLIIPYQIHISSHLTLFSSAFKDIVCQEFCISVVYLQLLASPFWSPSKSAVGTAAEQWITSWLMCLCSGWLRRLGWVKVLCTNNIYWGDFSFFLALGYSDLFLSGVFVIGDGVGSPCFLPELSWDINIFWYRNSITFCLELWK